MFRYFPTVLVFSLGLSVPFFQNCTPQTSASTAATGTSLTYADDSSADSSSGTDSSELLTITSSDYDLAPGETAQIYASGGIEPYYYVVDSGSGSIDTTGGLFTAGTATETVIVSVTDSQGLRGSVALAVATATNSVTCPTISVSSTESCSGGKDDACSVSVDFSSQVPAGCKVSALRLSASHFSSTGSGCSTLATFEFAGTSIGGSGTNSHKIAYLTASADFDAKALLLTSYSYGWGSCGGNSCNACISGVSFEVDLAAE